jgi:hypothetical protein
VLCSRNFFRIVGAPTRIFPFQADDDGFDLGRQAIRLPIRPATAIGQGVAPIASHRVSRDLQLPRNGFRARDPPAHESR